jgi:hypothetical protein
MEKMEPPRAAAALAVVGRELEAAQDATGSFQKKGQAAGVASNRENALISFGHLSKPYVIIVAHWYSQNQPIFGGFTGRNEEKGAAGGAAFDRENISVIIRAWQRTSGGFGPWMT